MATTALPPSNLSLPPSPSGRRSPDNHGMSSNATPTKNRIEFDPDLHQLPLPSPISTLPMWTDRPFVGSPNAPRSPKSNPDALRRHHKGSPQQGASAPRSSPRSGHLGWNMPFRSPPPPPPPPPPPGSQPTRTSLPHLPPPPPPPYPPPPYPPRTDFGVKGVLNARIHDLKPSVSLPLASWQDTNGSAIDATLDEEDDYFEQQNSMSFPPLVPTVRLRQSTDRERKRVTGRIAQKMSRLERSRSPVPSLESDASSVASTGSLTHSTIQKLWVQMKERRQNLYNIKQHMAEMRRDLRKLRQEKDEADNVFMKLLRPVLVKGRQGVLGTSHETLDLNFVKMQSLRTEYHSLESAYEACEVTLDEQEEELNNIETRFFSLLVAGSMRDEPDSDTEDSEEEEREDHRNMPYELKGISRHRADDAHPLWQDLVSAIGDLNNAKEEHEDLLRTFEQYSYESKIKKSVGRQPSKEETEFLGSFQEEERIKRGDVDRLTDEVAQLRQMCEEKGVMKKHPPFRIAYALDPDIGEDLELDDAWPQSESLAHDKFPDLLSCPDHVLRAKPLTVHSELKAAMELPMNDPLKETRLSMAKKEHRISKLLSEFKADNKPDFVTRWLLHHLRTSPLAVEVLYATFVHTVRLRIENRRQWQQDVLFHWWKDGAVKSPDDFFGPVTVEGILSPEHGSPLVQTSISVKTDHHPPASSRAAPEDISKIMAVF